jgi:hexosaminidase
MNARIARTAVVGRFVLFLVAVVAVAAVAPLSAAQLRPDDITPRPAAMRQGEGTFVLNDRVRIVAAGEAKAAAKVLREQLEQHCGINLQIFPQPKADRAEIALQVRKGDGEASPESYSVMVCASGHPIRKDFIGVFASSEAGLFYGCQSLLQLVDNQIALSGNSGKLRLPAVTIADRPRIAWRGLMLDVSRHFFDADEIKAVLDQMAYLKLNRLHWHLTDDHGWRIEIKKYPKLTELGAWRPATAMERGSKHIHDGRYGGFYTQEQIRDVVAYAARRHIVVVPEIEMPGHSSPVAVAYPELSPGNGWKPVLARQEKGSGERCAAVCVGRPATVQFFRDVLGEVMQLFPSQYIHICGDEVFYDQWKPCRDMQALKQRLAAKDWEEVQIHFSNEMAKFLLDQGRIPIFWNNIYRQTLDKRSVNQFWRSMGPARDFANAGYDVLLSPYDYYLDHAVSLEQTYRFDPWAIGIKPQSQKHILGICGCNWTERVPTSEVLQQRLFPRMIAVAETGWTSAERRDYQDFARRVPAVQRALTPRHVPQPGDADFPQPTPSARHTQKVAAVKSGQYDLVLIGDSITQTVGELDGEWAPLRAVWQKHYAPRNALNLGYSGYRTENILWNLENGELDFARAPKVAMLLIGTNNTDDQHYPRVHTAEQVFAGTKAIVDLIRGRHPTTKIIVLRIFPCGGPGDKTSYHRRYNRSAKCVEAYRKAGEMTARLADGKNVFWLDVGHVFLQPDGTIDTRLMPDLIHPNAAGAEAWAQAVEPTLAKLLGEQAERPPAAAKPR